MPQADDNIKAVLVKAANDPLFFRRLLKNRETALKEFPLAEHERAMLLAIAPEQLKKMVDEAGRRPWFSSSTVIKVAAGGAVVAAIAALAMPVTLGHTSDAVYEEVTKENLQIIVNAEKQYKELHGVYGTLEDVMRGDVILRDLRRENFPYTIEVKIAGDTFIAIARHKTRPGTRKNFAVGPDGVVKTLEAQEAQPGGK